MRLAIAGNDVAGLTLALRLRIKGHDVVVHPAATSVGIAEQFTVIAPFRDLFLKSGGALDDLIGLREVVTPLTLTTAGEILELPTAGTQVPVIARVLGQEAGQQWSRLLSDAADTWLAVRTETFTPRTSLHAYVRQYLPDTRLHELVRALVPYPNLRQLNDAAIVFPYLRQTFGVWEFDGGIQAFEHVLRQRCTDLGIEHSTQSAPATALRVDDHFRTTFTAPRGFVRRPMLDAPVTQRLGLSFIGMAAEAIANRIGRANAQ